MKEERGEDLDELLKMVLEHWLCLLGAVAGRTSPAVGQSARNSGLPRQRI